MIGRVVGLSCFLLAAARSAPAQLTTIRTSPVARGDQFEIFPTRTAAMAGVSIALRDTLGDPFRNPALGARVGGRRFFSAPGFFNLSHNSGAGRTLPVGMFTPAGAWFGGVALAVQEIEPRRPRFSPLDRAVLAITVPVPPSPSHPESNSYAFGMLGKSVTGTGVSVGASVLWARLRAVDGVDVLYAGSDGFNQFGHAVDARIGVVKEWTGGRTLEGLALFNRIGMKHDVTFLDQLWDPGTQQPVQVVREERHRDGTTTWGLQARYQLPLGTAGWRIGWLATANRISYPRTSGIDLLGVPHDPGNATGADLGIGVSQTKDGVTFGLDVVASPAWSATWARATSPTPNRIGTVIPTGGKILDNRFRFSNALVRIGFDHQRQKRDGKSTAGLQYGLIVRSTRYTLTQDDYLQLSRRIQEEGWLEWTPTWGASLRLPSLELRYRGQVTLGTGRPGVQTDIVFFGPDDGFPGRVPPLPGSPLTLTEVRVVTHQISLSFPLR